MSKKKSTPKTSKPKSKPKTKSKVKAQNDCPDGVCPIRKKVKKVVAQEVKNPEPPVTLTSKLLSILQFWKD